MSIDLKGQQCPVCKAFLFEEDDVVFCPECGAPHHRECYLKLGHCALEEFHGTDRQYSKPKPEEKSEERSEEKSGGEDEKKVVCYYCFEEYPRDYKNCPHCGNFNASAAGNIGFDPLGGVPTDFELDGGVTAKQAARFVMSSSNRYIPKFAKFKAGSKASWNWIAFLIPEGWALHRKMYKPGIIAITLMVLASLLAIPFMQEMNVISEPWVEALNSFAAKEITSEELMTVYQQMETNIAGIGLLPKLLYGIAIFTEIGTRFFFAIFGNFVYYKHTVSSLKEISQMETEEGKARLLSKGGNNLWLLLVGMLITSYLPSILMYIAQLF